MAYVVDVLTLAAILVIATHGYMLIKGLGGMLHLGHAVFYGIGAYAAAIASTKLLPAGSFPISVAAGGAAALIGGLVVGWPALRNRGRYFMIVTFAVQLIFVTLVINLHFTGGPDGISSIPGISFGGWQPTHATVLALGPVTAGYAHIKLATMCAMAALSYLVCRRMIGSSYGRLVRAVRDDELATEAYGRKSTPVKASILMVGAGVTGVAGALFAHHFNYVGPTQFELDATILFLIMLIVGGQYSLTGATVGALLMVLLLEALRFLLDNVLSVPFDMTAHLRQVVFAVTLVVVLAWRSTGLVPERLRKFSKPAAHGDIEPVGATAAVGIRLMDAPPSQPVLVCRGLRKSFGGVVAVADASFSLHPGRIVAIIGPNGAGKTSAFNILTGFAHADAGEASLSGVPILGRSTAEIARLGLARTFQDVRVWPRLTTIENLLVVKERVRDPSNWLPAQPRLSLRVPPEHIAQVWALLERFGLADHANTPAGQLSYAQRKMVSLARIACFDPSVMLLDEPTSGVDPRRLDTFLQQIKSFSAAEGRAICLIEHNMAVVRDLADEVVFMDEGRVIATGAPGEILGDRQLMRVYLGHRELEGGVMLKVDSLVSGYGADPILRGVTFAIPDKSIVAVLGHNGAGKSTLVRALVGLIPAWQGRITLGGRDVTREGSSGRVRAGLAVSFQDDAVFPSLRVDINLTLGAHVRDAEAGWVSRRRAELLETFPKLQRLLDQPAYTLSGGERRMLSIAMALMSDPRLLILDEPSTGLSPAVTEFVFDTIVTIRDRLGKSILLIEQNVQQALAIADQAVVLKVGSVIFEGQPSLLARETTELVTMF